MEGDVMDAHATRHRARRGVGILNREEVHGVAVPLERHEDASVLGVFLDDLEPEDRRVEGPRPLDVAHAQQHMADPVESNHRPLLIQEPPPCITAASARARRASAGTLMPPSARVYRAARLEASGAIGPGQARPEPAAGESRRMAQRAPAWRTSAAAMAAAKACTMPARSIESARTKKKPAKANSPSSSPRSTRMAGPGPSR